MPKTIPFDSTHKPPRVQDGSANFTRILWRYLTEKVQDKKPAFTLPTLQPDLSGSHDMLIKISHSTVLIRLDGQYILTDPVFSKRASPFSFIGPKRFHTLPMTIAELPRLDVVVISHDHYDHLDKASIKALAAKTAMFVVPTGLDRHLRRFGVSANKIKVLAWWQEVKLGSLRFHATPAQHFSGRGLFDKNKTSWASFVIESSRRRIFFSGDSGYFAGFSEIAKRFGRFDVSLIETGAYDELWPDIHMQPEQSLRAHLDLQADYMIPIHNSSFDLAMHAWYEPLQRLANAAETYQVPLITPIFGAAVDMRCLDQAPEQHGYWWQSMVPKEAYRNMESVLLAC